MTARKPRLLDRNLREITRLSPEHMSITLNASPLSTADMDIAAGTELITTGMYMELYTQRGSAGIYRISMIDTTYGDTMHVTLEHGLTTLSDDLLVGEGEETTGVAEAVGRVLSAQPVLMWKLGRVDVPEDVTITWSWDNSNLLESIISIMDELPAYLLTVDQSSLPWTINIVRPADNAACECRLNRNLETVRVTMDHTQLCTRMYIEGVADPVDADTIADWGVVARYMQADPEIGKEALIAEARAYLEAHKQPQMTVTMDALELAHATGHSFDAFNPGDVCRVCLPGYSTTIRQRIVSVSYPDVIQEPTRASVTLANAAESAVTTLSGLIVNTTINNKRITRTMETVRQQGDLILASEEAVKIYGERLDVLVKEVEIKADKILLDAYVKITDLAAEVLEVVGNSVLGPVHCERLYADGMVDAEAVSCGELSAGDTEVDSLAVGGTPVSMQSTEVVTGVGGRGVTGEFKTIQYLNWDGAKASTSVMTGFSQAAFSTEKKTLNYIGAAPDE